MKQSILVVDDEAAIGIAVQRLLKKAGYRVDVCLSGEEAIEALGHTPYHLIITDLSMQGMSGMDLLVWARKNAPETSLIMITAYGSEKTAVDAMKLGASDYVPKPFDNDELELKVGRVLEARNTKVENQLLRERVETSLGLDNFVGRSPAMQQVFDVIRKVADSDLTVLVRGPSGTGKELVANAIHLGSPRKGQPLVKVNCAAFTRELVESELFGHEKGAFTGALRAREGKFELADHGTLFLDEIGDMALETQAKILRALQEKEIQRVGGDRTLKVDVRIIAATNHDLEAKVAEGSFREDLFYRLNVVPIQLPPLRDREGDLPLLVDHFLDGIANRLGRARAKFTPAALRALADAEWKGNVRELEHVVEQSVILADGLEIDVDGLPDTVRTTTAAVPGAEVDETLPFKEAKQLVVANFERSFLKAALARNEGNISRTAEDVGMYRQHLQGKLTEYGIEASAFREPK